jgi:flagellar protein FlaG
MLIQNVTSNIPPAPTVSNDNVGTPAVVVSAQKIDVKPIEHLQPTPASGTQAAQSDKQLPSSTNLPSDAQLQNALEKINQAMRQNNTNLEFSIDQESKQMLIKVVDSNTGETIRQFPSKEAIVISEAIDQFQKGILIKQKA